MTYLLIHAEVPNVFDRDEMITDIDPREAIIKCYNKHFHIIQTETIS